MVTLLPLCRDETENFTQSNQAVSTGGLINVIKSDEKSI